MSDPKTPKFVFDAQDSYTAFLTWPDGYDRMVLRRVDNSGCDSLPDDNVFGCLLPKAQEALKNYLNKEGVDISKIAACNYAGGRVFLYTHKSGKAPSRVVQVSTFYPEQSNYEDLKDAIYLLPKEISNIVTLCQLAEAHAVTDSHDTEALAGDALEAIQQYLKEHK
jgi:hypothetical protein